jgi:hypothetical protein
MFFSYTLEQAIQNSENGINNRDLQLPYPNNEMQEMKPLSPTLQNKVCILDIYICM